MKYTVELSARMRGIQLLQLTEEERDELIPVEDLDEVYPDWVDRKDYDFAVEGYYLHPGVDRYSLIIRNEDGDEVYSSDEFTLKDKTYDREGGVELPGWEFSGVAEDGDYLVRLQVIKGCEFRGEFNLDGEFNPEKLYVIRDTIFNDALSNEDYFPADTVYYRRGDEPVLDTDRIDLEFLGDCGEQYWNTHMLHVEYGDEWTDLQD